VDLDQKAEKFITVFSAQLLDHPVAYTQLLAALDFMIGPSQEIVIAGDSDLEATQTMFKTVQKKFLPNKILLHRPEKSETDSIFSLVPFIKNMVTIDHRPTVYICKQYACQRPITDMDELVKSLNWSNMKDIRETDLKPSQFLVENIQLLPKGRTLDVAMGNGRNALYLATMGFEVEGVDISQDAVNHALECARASGLKLKARVVDLEKDFSIEKNAYDVIICFNYLQRSLIHYIREGLQAGGMVVYETYIIDQAQVGKPKNPDYLLKHNELLDMFHDFRCLRYREGIMEGRKALASIIAEKVDRSKS